MVLKTYDKKTNSFNPISIKIFLSYTDKTGTVNTCLEEFKDSNSVLNALNTKISKKGDIVEGTIQFGDGFGISGVSLNGTIYNNSTIQYCKTDDGTKSGYFKIANYIKDTSNLNNPASEDYFNLICDSTPTENSKNLLTSGTVYTILLELNLRITQLENN